MANQPMLKDSKAFNLESQKLHILNFDACSFSLQMSCFCEISIAHHCILISLQEKDSALRLLRFFAQYYMQKGSISNRMKSYPIQPIDDERRPQLSTKKFIRKTLADNKTLRFQQCFFNPISCFRR